jgi:lipopolysaccharide/colanic/teichoic acid biosynthesis glycosyltransferase|tara:strand:- start:125 stop:853 length:729 start_codon:yes stop_codon:yes gene_type:complete
VKRLLDILISFSALLLFSPLLVTVMFLVWRQDRHSPFYVAPRVGLNQKDFNMVKLRSMIIDADKTGVDSTGSSDQRITPIGKFIRKYKLDELTQLWNVLIGDMSLVGPRPNVRRETDLYTEIEKVLLKVKPGITDFASIVFSDEGDILEDKEDPDLAYNQLIRPWKSRLGLIYIENENFFLDIKIIFYTVISILKRDTSIAWVVSRLASYDSDPQLIEVSRRNNVLYPFPPPGSDVIVGSRD